MNDKRPLPVIVDTTLRDGIQMPGTVLSFNDKTAILDRLVLLGIKEIEIGCPAQGSDAVTEIGRLCKRHPSIDCSTWCRARKTDILAAAATGVSTIHISFPVSDRHLAIRGWSREEMLRECTVLIEAARCRVSRVTVGAQDALRTDPDFLKLFVANASSAGAARIRIADTVGSATPQAVGRLITDLIASCPAAAFEYHGHNDFGLATATTLAAMEAGAAAVSVTVQGVGERAGNAPLEEVITAAVMLYGYSTGLCLAALSELCRCTSHGFHLPERPDKAICGTNAFRHESGIHCYGMLRDELAYQPINPATVGEMSRYSIGRQSGYSSLQAVLREQGLSVNRHQARSLWRKRHEP